MARKLKNGIIKSVCEYAQDTEVPDIFALWSGIACVGACLGRDCFVDQGHFTIYPNMYIVLVAGSAKCRKSTSINMASDFLSNVPDTRQLSQKMTPEALIAALSGNSGEEGGTVVLQEAEGIALVDELATLIDSKAFANGMIPVLTKLFDCQDFPYETRSRGVELVRNPCLSIFGGSTLHWIKECIPVVAIGGGFTSRIIFVYRDAVAKLIPWPERSDLSTKLRTGIIHDLCEIKKLRGSFGFTAKAKEVYSKEYKEFIINSKMFESKNLSGYAGRRHVMLLKLSMIISASNKDTREVDVDDVAVAIRVLKNCEETMPKVLNAITSEAIGDISEEVLSIIIRRGTVARHILVQQVSNRLSSRELDIILETLLEMEVINAESIGSKIMYNYIGK